VPDRARPAGVPQLVPTDAAPLLPELDQRRNLGLAYVMAAARATDRDWGAAFHQRGRNLLWDVHQAGIRDAAVVSGLMKINLGEQNEVAARPFAQELLDAPGATIEMRLDALQLLAAGHLNENRIPEAVTLLERLTQTRRVADDWRILGTCHLDTNQPGKALAAFERGQAIDPFDPRIHSAMAVAHDRLENAPRSKFHADKAVALSKKLPR
jgi:tetratricopeptide (TPR) repeat protein